MKCFYLPFAAFIFSISMLVFNLQVTAQINPYILNGAASQIDCHCYTLTPDQFNVSGSVWNKNKIDLSETFDFYFNVYLGCSDDNGADGIAFVLQPVSTSLGSTGEGMGFSGIVPSLGITMDTYQNGNQSDPSFDHIALQSNGDVNHNSTNNIAGPFSASVTSSNIEDCSWHILRIFWQPDIQLMEISFDGELRISVTQDFINTIFGGDPLVFWGFTSATGGATNLQQMCTSLDAKFTIPSNQNTCIGTPISFRDSSISFGSIDKWFWDFGDGTTDTIEDPPPHLYAQPGIYTVKQNILGNDGCLSDTFKKVITVGSVPQVDFTIDPDTVCDNSAVLFSDSTIVEYGTKSSWYWNFGNGSTSTLRQPPLQAYPNSGIYEIKLVVETLEGCVSDTSYKTIRVDVAPRVSFTANDACKNTPVIFTARNLAEAPYVSEWQWNFGDGETYTGDSVINHIYKSGAVYTAFLVASANNGCPSDTISQAVTIYATQAFAGNDTTILLDQPFQLQAQGGDFYQWTPSDNLSNPFIPNPVVTLSADAVYYVIATTSFGCATIDSIKLKVVKGPEIYIPTAFSPNGDGLNDKFNIVPVGLSALHDFRIYSRWGQVLFTSKNSKNGWDGTFKGVLQQQGTYVYMVSGTTIDGRPIKKQGTFVLIR